VFKRRIGLKPKMVVPSTMSRTTGKGTTRTTIIAIKVLPPSHMAKVPNSIISPLSQWIKTSVSTARRLGTSRKTVQNGSSP
jgi:hypothetical protein